MDRCRSGRSPLKLGPETVLACSDAGYAVEVEQVVEAQADLGLIEARAVADGVVQVGVGEAERVNRGLVVIARCRRVELGADALVEDTDVPSRLLIGEAFGLGVGGRLRDPEARQALATLSGGELELQVVRSRFRSLGRWSRSRCRLRVRSLRSGRRSDPWPK